MKIAVKMLLFFVLTFKQKSLLYLYLFQKRDKKQKKIIKINPDFIYVVTV